MSFAKPAQSAAGSRRTTRSGAIPARGALTPIPGTPVLLASVAARAESMPPRGVAMFAAGVAPLAMAAAEFPAAGVTAFGGVEPGVDDAAAPGGFTSDARSEATLAGADGGDWLIAGLTNRAAYGARI